METREKDSARRRSLALSLLGLAAFLALEALAVRRHQLRETRPPSWDQSIHLEIALDYRRAMDAGRWRELWLLAPKPGMPPFPPLYHLALSRVYDFSDPARAALTLNWLYLCLLCLSILAITREFRPDQTALAAAVAFACAPAVQELLYAQLVDLPVAALSAAAFWALLRSEGFERWGGSLAFGALFGAGMLHKWSFFSYMLPAYYAGWKALASPARSRALAAAAIALALCLPWYLPHLPVLVPRLFQAGSDFAVPFWREGAFFRYFLDMAELLGPLLWSMGWLGLLIPLPHWDRRAAGWPVLWTLGSYAFWAVVPNRQMRFLLPGLPGLAIFASACWPRALVAALAAFQLLTAFNYQEAALRARTLRTPLRTITLFPSSPPAREDWKVEQILREAERRRDPGAPFSNLTLVANDAYFNGPNFTWESKLLGLGIRPRGVNSRLCELSEFVVLKKGSLGPPSVISGLPEAERTMRRPDGWFARGYAELRRWPLPDGGAAVLFQRLKRAFPPMRGQNLRFEDRSFGPLRARGLSVELGPWDKDKGAWSQVLVEARALELRGLRVLQPRLELEDAFLLPAAEAPGSWSDARLLRLGRLRLLSATVEAADLARFLEARAPGLRVSRLEARGGRLRLEAAWKWLAAGAEASAALRDGPRRLELRLESARVGPVRVPGRLLRLLRPYSVPLTPTPETPFHIEVPGLTLDRDRISIP